MTVTVLDQWGVRDPSTYNLNTYDSLDEAKAAAEENMSTRYADKWSFVDVQKKNFVNDGKELFQLEKVVDISSCSEDDHFWVINSVMGGIVHEPTSLSELNTLAENIMEQTKSAEDFGVVYRKTNYMIDSDQPPFEGWILAE